MKQFLLVLSIALPSFVLGQAPTLTFNPADGATNVNPATNITITFSEAVKQTDGNNFDDAAAEALITLEDQFGTPVSITGTINGPKTVITVNPDVDLADLTTYTLIVGPVEAADDGSETSGEQITFTTGDYTDPVVNTAKGIDNTGTGVTFMINVNEDATVYYVVDNDNTTPSKAEILAGQNGDGNPPDASGSFAVTGGVDAFESISGLAYSPTKQYIYFFVRDASPQANETNSVDTRGLPVLNSSSIQNLTAFSFDLRVNVDEAATTYYVVTQSSTPPSPAQILAGQDELGGTPDKSGNFAVTAGNDIDESITGLNDGVTYYVYFLATDGSDNETVVGTESATTPDGTPPAVTLLSPADGSTTIDISTNTFTITFDENVNTINVAAVDDTDRIRLFENGVMVEDINRDDTTVGTDGAIDADGTSNVATITFVYDLKPNENYYILIGEDVFEDASGNDFAGYLANTDWNFTTSGVTVNNPVANICSGSFQSLGNIVISEAGAADFNNGAGQTLVLSLGNTSEFVFSNAGVSVNGTSADITSLSVSVGLTSLTVTYTVAGGTTVDNITISGLKVYATGDVASTTIIRSGGTADQDGGNGTGGSSLTYATINVGATAPSQPQLDVAQDVIHCVDEDISAKTLTLVDQSGEGAISYDWYTDESLSTLAVSTASTSVNIVSDLGLTSPAVAGTYSFYVVTVGGCQSAPPVEITIEVSANPVANAGTDKTGVDAVCTGTQLTLGGNPTLQVPSAPGAYTYSWEYVEGTPEPNAEANPAYTVTNASTTTTATYNFEVTVTDVNGCAGTDILTVEVKPTFTPYLQSPSSSSFTPTSPNQTLVGFPAGGVFTGVGVVQSGSPATYQFSPVIAHATDPNTLPKNFNIYYTVTDNGCTITNYPIATFTISNSFFTNLQPQYCSSEYPTPASSGVNLGFDSNGNTYMLNQKNNWNTSSRFSRVAHATWVGGNIYSYNSYVRYNNEFYRCNNVLLGCTGFTTPDLDGQYVYENILKVQFNGRIMNYYEGYYGGNASGATVVKSASGYSVDGYPYVYYRFGTNANYNNCSTCNYAYPAAYLEFERPEDIKLMMQAWNVSYYYYPGDLVVYANNVYKCIANPYTVGTQPDLNPGLWTNVTNSDYFNGQFFHIWNGVAFESGYYVRGQFVQINRNPTVFFSGLTNGQGVCEFEVLDLDNPGGSNTNLYNLKGNYANQALDQEFLVRLDGAGTFDLGGGAITNSLIEPGTADFDTKLAFENSSGGTTTLKSIQIQYQVDPGTDGSTGQACYGTSNITVQVRQNSTFDFDNTIVDADGSVYCYTEGAKDLRSVFGATVINGVPGGPNSVVYNGYGVNNVGGSQGSFSPGIAIDQILPGTNTQQSVPVTALYRDVNQCQSTRERTFKVNPDLQPSFTFAGRVNYCYEDVANNFTGHFEDFVAGGTIPSTGSYNIVFRDPANNPYLLQNVNANNMAFNAQPLYDQIQTILTNNGFASDLNQTANINVIYTETLNAGKVCSETYAQPMVINPPIVLDIFGLNDGDIFCRNDNNNVSMGNIVSFDGSVTGSGIFNLDDDTDFSAINPTLDATVSTVSGKATINLLNAYNAASDGTDPRQVYLRYQYTAPGCTGPANIIEGFEISPPPALAFDFGASPANGEVFCNDEAPVALATLQTTNVTLSGYGITDSGTGSGGGTFNPQLGYNTSISNGGTLNTQQNIAVTARIVDGLGCANVNTIQYKVNPVPQATLTPGNLYYCYEDAPRDLQGQQSKSWFTVEYQGVTTPHTEIIGDINNPMSTLTWEPDTRFDDAVGNYGASALTPVDFHVYYSVADNNNCTNTIGPYIIQVANQIEVSIAGVDNKEIYCSNENNGVRVLTFNPFPADASKREFSIDGVTVALSSDKYNFTPGLAGDNQAILKYVVISGNNCTNTAADTVNVLPSPEAIFSVNPACDSALISYDADGTTNLGSAIYTWTLADSVRTGQNLQHRFPGVSTYSVQLHVQYPAFNGDPTLVCKDSLRLDQIVGPIPNMDFTFFDVCESDQTSFEAKPDIPISTVAWDFGDGETTAQGFLSSPIPATATTSGTFEAPMHKYAGAANYTVTVTGKTSALFGGCIDSEQKEISILKNWAPTPAEPFYDMASLDGGRGFWVKEDVRGNATWEFNTAAKTRINTTEAAWVTGATQPYAPNDVSYMNSPCFDLSGFSRPVLSLNHWVDTDFSDGAVVQYSTDGGETWARLGNVASGLDWYNRLTIAANPGGQTGISSGWSAIDQETWATGKHSLDGILPAERAQVRFRVAFASVTNPENRDGFAFNNVIIEERNRTVLVENFTNTSNTDNNAAFREFPTDDGSDAFNAAELVKLQYHHTSEQNTVEDDLHLTNPTDQNARAAFYGVTTPVRAFIDGGFGQAASNPTFGLPNALNGDITNYYSLRSLVTSPVDISIDFEADPSNADPSKTLNVKASVQATSDLGNPGQYNIFIAVAEKQILNEAYVLRKFLPNASGIPLTSLSATDPAQVIYATYDMRHVTRRTDGTFEPFAVIVFVQHLETKEVLQTIMREDGTGSSEIVTGVETSFDNMVRLYPNPADAILHVVLPAPVQEETPVSLFDTFGKEVAHDTFRPGEHIKTIETKSFSGGVYLIQLSTPGGIIRKKAMIVHE